MSEPATPPALAEQLAGGALDPELLALVWMLAESGVPLTVAATDSTAARDLRNGICALLPADHHAADLALAGGTVVAGSLEDVLRVLGGGGHAVRRRATATPATVRRVTTSPITVGSSTRCATWGSFS